MGTVNNSNKTWHVVICVLYNNFEEVFKKPGNPEAHLCHHSYNIQED